MADDRRNQQVLSLKISTPSLPLRKTPPTWWFKACGLAVHCYTASGAIVAFLIVLAAIHGNVVLALWLALAALIIDGTDGWLARYFRVSETLPWFDGRRLDDIVDYLTYVFAPVLLLWNTGHLPSNVGGMFLAALPLLASGYQFCRTDAKTSDHFFLGFPSYWNVVAFYAIIFHQSLLLTGIILLICSLLVFIPIRYLYPSRTVFFRPLTLVLTVLWLLCYALIVQEMPTPSPWLMYLSLLYIIYYIGMSLYLTLRISVVHTRQ